MISSSKATQDSGSVIMPPGKKDKPKLAQPVSASAVIPRLSSIAKPSPEEISALMGALRMKDQGLAIIVKSIIAQFMLAHADPSLHEEIKEHSPG